MLDGLLKRKYTCDCMRRSGENISMTFPNIMGEAEDCVIFGMASISGSAILFHAIMENGAVFYRLPISAFIQRGFDVKKVPRMRLDELELWNCFSYYPAISSFDILLGQSGKYIGKDKKWYSWSLSFYG